MTLKTPMIAAMLTTALMASGCSQFSEITKGYWVDGESVSLLVANSEAYRNGTYQAPSTTGTTQMAELRSAPAQKINFVEGEYDVELFDMTPVAPAATSFAGYDVELFDMAPAALRTTPAASYAMITDPRDAAFVKLNGKGAQSDWTYCDATNQGYLLEVEGDFRLNPNFEVCMRNKGYVMSTEAGPELAGMAIRAEAQTPMSSYGYPEASYP